jgi:hypothetical protein
MSTLPRGIDRKHETTGREPQACIAEGKIVAGSNVFPHRPFGGDLNDKTTSRALTGQQI